MKSLTSLSEQLKVAVRQVEADESGANDTELSADAREAGKERTRGIPKGAEGEPSGRTQLESFASLLDRNTRYLRGQ